MKPLIPIFFMLASAILGQTTGELHGVVTDPSNQTLAHAQVTLRSDTTGTARNAETDDGGEFVFAAVPVGEYTVEVDADGFKTFVQRYVQVTLGHVVTVPVHLEAGETTKVLAMETPLIETTSTQMGAVVSGSAVVNLPLDQRDTYQLLQLQPGVQSQQGYDLFAGSDNSGVVSVNGGRGRSNNFNVNGGEANDLFVGVPAIQPSPDAIEEFRVLTSGFDAEYGRNSGSIVNVVTRSGSNQFHADLFEFFRNKALNTRGFFDTEKAKFNQNQFGGTVGGPIKRDRAYFFASTENRRIRQGISSDLVRVPTAGERGGDFSGSDPFAGTLTDPFLADKLNQRPGCSSAVGAGGGTPIAANTPWSAIFPNNKIPVQCYDPTALDLLKQFVPLPNAGDGLLQTVPVYSGSAIQTTVRLDYSLNAQNQLSFFHYLDDGTTAQPFARFQAGGSNIPGFGSNYATRDQQFNLSETWAIGPTAVNEARFVYFREGELNFNHPARTGLVQGSCATVAAGECFSDPSDPRLGIMPNLGAQHEGVPFIVLSGSFAIGNNSEGEMPQVGNTFQWSDSLSKVKGSHSMKFGADVRRMRFDQTLYYNVNGAFSFNSGGANDVGANTLFPDYLLGLPNGYTQGSAQSENLRTTAVSLFAQDSWSVSRHLTLNYGLRWELTPPMSDVGQRLQSFRPGQATQVFPCRLDAGNPLVDAFGSADCGPGSAGESVFPMGLVVPGDRGVPGGLTSTYYKSLAPRIGIAWSPQAESGLARKLFGGPGKTSIRAGWGMFYNPVEQLVLMQFSGEPPFGGSVSVNAPLFNTPFLGQDGSAHPNAFNGILNPTRGQAIDWSAFRPISLFGDFEPHLRSQYSMNYNVTVQRQLTRDLLFQAAYVGSQGRRLLGTHDLNYGQAQPCLDLNQLSSVTGDASLACGPFSADSSFTIAANEIPKGFTLHLPYGPQPSVTGPNPNPITLVGLRRYSSPLCDPLTGNGCAPDGIPVFGSIFAEDSVANSGYNSLQVSAEKRSIAGLQFQAAYTFSKSIDNASSFENLLNPLNYGLSRSLSYFDARHRLVFSYRWDLPRVRVGGFGGRVLNGWSSSGIFVLQSGFPIPITSSDDLELMNSGFFVYPGEPDRVAPLQKLNPRNGLNLAFDPASFQQPSDLGRIGNSPRTVCCGPGMNNLDFSLMKNMAIAERYKLQFRGEFFNVVNHAQFSKVDGNISDGDPASGGTFGKVLRARDPRLVQFALKLQF
jgi:outer membrane receptor protein involved in Fe transport